MTRVLKGLGALLIVVLLLYVASTWWVGKQIEKHYFEPDNWRLGAHFEDSLYDAGLGVSIEPKEIERHWFSSNADFTVKLTDLDEGESFTVAFQQDIHHGPFPLGHNFFKPLIAHGQIHLDREHSDSIFQEIMEDDFIEQVVDATSLDYTMNLTGAVRVKLAMDPIRYSSYEADLMTSNASFDLQLTKNRAFKSLKGGVDVIDLTTKIGGLTKLWLRDLSLDSRSQLKGDHRKVKQVVKVNSMGSEADEITSEIERFKLTFDGELEQSRHRFLVDSSKLTAVYDSLVVNDSALGGFEFALSSKDLDLSWLQEKQAIEDIDNHSLTEELLRMFLENEPSFSLDTLKFKNDEGELSLAAKVDLFPHKNMLGQQTAKIVSSAELALDENYWPEMLKRFSKASVLDKNELALAEESYTDSLEFLQENNLLVKKENQYLLDAQLNIEDEIAVKVNGETLPEDELAVLGILLFTMMSEVTN